MLNVNVINAKNSQKIEVKPGQPASVKVEPGTRFELADAATGKAPAQIKGRRNGDNLEIVVDEKAQVEEAAASNAQSPDLVLENYYKQEDVSLFAGTGEAAVSYVPVDGAAANAYAAMNTSANTGAAVAALPIMSSWMGVAAAGTGLALAGGGGGGSTPVTNKAPVATDAKATVDENGVLKGNVPAATDAEGHFVSYKLTTTINSADGKLNFNSDGSYTFTPFNFDYLAKGSSAEVSFNYVAVDIFGATSEPKTVKITITGANDSPTIKVKTGDSVSDSDKATLGENDPGAKGTLTLGDVDLEKGSVIEQGTIYDVIDVRLLESSTSTAFGQLTVDLKFNLMKMFYLPQEQITLNSNNNLEWVFDTTKNPYLFDIIAAGKTIELAYSISITDKHNSVANHDVVLTIIGENDAPLIFTDIETDSSEGTVDSELKASGTLTVIDEDVLTAKVANVKLFKGADASSPEVDVKGLKLEELLQTGGSFADTNELHNLTWSFVGDASKTNGLASGAYTLAYDIAISDQKLTSHQTVNIHFQV